MWAVVHGQLLSFVSLHGCWVLICGHWLIICGQWASFVGGVVIRGWLATGLAVVHGGHCCVGARSLHLVILVGTGYLFVGGS